MSGPELDLCTLALLAELDALDTGFADASARETALTSALQYAETLAQHGGGALSKKRVDALLQALRAELALCV